MRRLMFTLPLLGLLTLPGCMSPAKVIQQLKSDPASVDLQIMVPMYGSMIFHRSFPTNYIPAKP